MLNSWLGRQDSNFRIERQECRRNEEALGAVFVAERTGLPQRLERQCGRADKGCLALVGSPARWRRRHCGASVVTALMPSLPKDLKMSHSKTSNQTKPA